MTKSQHVFIHPLLNREERWGGLLVSASDNDPAQKCSKNLIRLGQEARKLLVGRSLPWFVPLNLCPSSEESDAWPQWKTIFLVHEPENSASDHQWAAPAEAIRSAEGRTGLIVHPSHTLPPADSSWDFVVLGASQARMLPPIKLVILTTQSSVILTGVKTREDYDWALANGMALADAEFLLHRSKGPLKPDILRMHVLKLLSLVTQDAETQEIEEIFRQEPKLSYSLLRLVNSAALNLKSPISSFSHAITLLGRRQLQRWLQLLAYAELNDDNPPNPLLQWAAMRGKLMELAYPFIAPTPQLAITHDHAFMVGIFSLLDVLLNLPMEEILAQLPIPITVKLALTERAGPLGELLCAIENAEQQKTGNAVRILEDLHIPGEDYLQVQLQALDWAHKVVLQAPPVP